MFLTRKKNPFDHLTNIQWQEYVSRNEPYFSEEPYYEVIPPERVRVIEEIAAKSGLKLILRTTINTAYYPTEYADWGQQTTWIYGFPSRQFLITINYSEYKMESGLMKNDFCIRLCLRKKLEHVDVQDEVDSYYVDFILNNTLCMTLEEAIGKTFIKNGKHYAERYTKLNEPTNYVFKHILTSEDYFEYEIVSKTKAESADKLIDIGLAPSMFNELINLNDFLPGKLNLCFLFSTSDTVLFVLRQNPVSFMLNCLFLKKVCNSIIGDFVTCPDGFICLMDYLVDGKFKRIVEGKRGDVWEIVRYPYSIFLYEDYRLTQEMEDLAKKDFSCLRVK